MVLKYVWPLCAFIFCSSFCPSSADVKEIKFSLSQNRGELKCRSNPPNIEIGEHFQIYVDPGDFIFHNVGRCYESLESKDFVDILFWKESDRKGFNSNRNINVNHLGDWYYECVFFTHIKCNLTTNRNICHYWDGNSRTDNGVKCSSKVRVVERGQIVVRPSGYMAVSGGNVSSAAEEHPYKFYEGEGAKFTCHKITGSFVKLTYTTRALEEISTGYQHADSVSMYLKLRPANHDATLTCTIADEQRNPEVNRTLRLSKISGTQGLLSFKVNGLILPSTQTSETLYYYEYKYYDGEDVTVAVVKDAEAYGDVMCSADGHLPQKLKTFFQETSKSFDFLGFTINKEETGMCLICTVSRINNGQETHHISLKFTFQTPNNSPYIAGLAMSNVLFQYSNETSNIIEYSIGSETLNLECLGPNQKTPTFWEYNSTGVISDLIDKTTNPRPFRLRPERHRAIIKCLVDSRSVNKTTTYLELQRKISSLPAPPLSSPNRAPPPASAPPPAAAPTPTPTPSSAAAPPTTAIHSTITKKDREAKAYRPKSSKSTSTITERPKSSKPKSAVQSTTPKAKSRNSSLVGQTPKPPTTTVKPTTTHPVTPTITVKPTTKLPVIPTTSTIAPTVNGGDTLEVSQNRTGQLDNSEVWLIVFGVVLVILIAAFMLWAAFKKKKNNRKNISSNMDYQNLPEHHEGPMEVPSQWNRPSEVIYAESNSNDNLYAKATPKSQINKTELTYADPRDSLLNHTYINSQQINEPTYASIQNNEPTYASVQNNEPAYASVQNNEPAYASAQKNEPAYASVQKSYQPGPTYANQKSLEYQNLSSLNKGNTYAEVGKNICDAKSDSPYGEEAKSQYQNKKKYLNDIVYADILCKVLNDTNKYVNADVKCDVEPAYCEVMKKN